VATASEEVYAACELLQSLGIRSFAPSVTACPGCGRTTSTTFQKQLQGDTAAHHAHAVDGIHQRLGVREIPGKGLEREEFGLLSLLRHRVAEIQRRHG